MTKKLYVVETISTFRHRYVVEAKELTHAFDEVTMRDSGSDTDDFDEVTQKHLGETIIQGHEITKEEFDKMLVELQSDKDELASYWMGDKLIRKIKYNDE
jgi:16S rRNA C1402 (ribose-2'-O) methylase RsmI